MAGQNQRTDADKHDDSREDDAAAVALQTAAACGVLIDQSLGDKDGIVIALTEDEGSQDDVDDVELDAQQLHKS